jgi:hypothetical protein
MAQFQVPQFLDIESKIVGPLTLKQFGFIAAPALISFFLFFTLNTVIWIIITAILMIAGAAFAFVKINGRPLFVVTIHAITFFWQPKTYIWKRPVIKEVIEVPTVSAKRATIEAKRSALQSALQSISGISKLFLDLTTTKNPIPKREKVVPKKTISEIKEQYQVFRKISGEQQVAKRVDYR